MHMMLAKKNVYNKNMRRSSSTETHYCHVCIHIENLFEGNKSKTTVGTPLICKVHLSVTHKLQNRGWMLWCQSKMRNYEWKCFHDKYALLLWRGNGTVAYCMEPCTKNRISSTVHMLQRHNWCSTRVLHDKMLNKWFENPEGPWYIKCLTSNIVI